MLTDARTASPCLPRVLNCRGTVETVYIGWGGTPRARQGHPQHSRPRPPLRECTPSTNCHCLEPVELHAAPELHATGTSACSGAGTSSLSEAGRCVCSQSQQSSHGALFEEIEKHRRSERSERFLGGRGVIIARECGGCVRLMSDGSHERAGEARTVAHRKSAGLIIQR